MRGLAAFRIALGTATWFAPRRLSRLAGVPEERITPELEYINRVFGVRAVTLGVGHLASSGEARAIWHRLWILCDAADTAMGAGMVARGRLGSYSGAFALLITGGALAIDLTALAVAGSGGPMSERERALTELYAAFNRRDTDAVLAAMHPEVDWPNAWEGGRVAGRDGVRAYWERQFEQISSRVDPVGFNEGEGDGEIVVEVHQLVHDPRSGDLLSDSRVRHRYRFEDGLIVRMDVLED